MATQGAQVLSREDFDDALIAYGSRTWFIWWLFFLCCSSCIMNGFHLMSYVFYSQTPPHWCKVPILDNAGWTPQQIRLVSSPRPTEDSNCEYYEQNYEELKGLGFESALNKVKSRTELETIPCEEFHYDVENFDTTFVPEWNMVCNRLAMKATVQMAVSLGKFLGAFTLGVFADKYGRKTTFILSSMIYMMSAPVIGWTRIYTIMIMSRIGVGVAGIGVYQSTYSLLIEICPPHLRSTLGVLFNQSYPLGVIIIAIIAYFVRGWRRLQWAISIPAYFLIFHMLLIPESPRWAYYSGRPVYGWYIIKNFIPPEKEQLYIEGRLSAMATEKEKTSLAVTFRRIKDRLLTQLAYMKHGEVRTRLFLCWAIWCFTSMTYYALSITSGALQIDSYLYTGLSGVVEGIAYILVVPMLEILGRRGTASFLLVSTGSAFVVLLILPGYMKNIKLFFALFGRLCISSVFVAVIIHASELFPTVMRNTAIGTSSAWSHIGSTMAPYLVDYFVIYGKWVPNVICGAAVFITALLAQLLPETKGIILYDTMEEFLDKCYSNIEEQISLHHCFIFRWFRKVPPAEDDES